MRKLKLIYQSEDGTEEIIEESRIQVELDSLSSIENAVEDFRKKALPKVTAKLLKSGESAYIKKKE